jgi:vacuolar-type H+-ATPase subunit H
VRDVIQKIVATENQAKRIVEEARAQADRVLAEARKQAQDISMKAYQDAGRQAQEIVNEAIRAAEDQKQESLAKASEAIEREVFIDEGLRQKIVEEIIRHVCGHRGPGKERSPIE